MPFGSPDCNFKSLDGGTYRTSLSGWCETTISTGEKVWTKLIFLGDKTKLVAISAIEAIRTGVDQLATKAEIAKARAKPNPQPTARDLAKARQATALTDKVYREAISDQARRKHPWLRDDRNGTAQTRRTRITEPVVATKPSKPTSKPSVDTSVAGMISSEAKRLKKGEE